jgi:uncharacterized membrane protein
MNGFVWALIGFVLIHSGISATGVRAAIVARVGEGAYRLGFSVVSAALLVWMIQGYGAMRADPFDPLNEALWQPPEWTRWPSLVLGLSGVALAVTGVLTRGPTTIGNETSGLAKAEPATGIMRVTRHPFMWGVALWAAAHLLVNGERFAVMLFGALGVMVLLGARSIDRKSSARNPEAWDRFADITSNAPFAAIMQGRNRLDIGEIGWRGLVGIAAAALVAWGHGLVGPPVL